jgi:hypothetical protein
VAGTNIGTQVVPGYVSEVRTTIRFDAVAKIGTPNADGSVTVPLFCNEYCGLGHQSMWGRVGDARMSGGAPRIPPARRLGLPTYGWPSRSNGGPARTSFSNGPVIPPAATYYHP